MLLLGPEYGTNKNTLKGALDEADHIADVHLTIKNRLLSEVQAQIKEWKNEHYKKQMVGGCKETKTFEDEFHKVRVRVDTADFISNRSRMHMIWSLCIQFNLDLSFVFDTNS